jgi:FlaA1/EpsC-like NDP-sugar epimerase
VLAGGIGIARLRYEEFALIKRGVMLRVYDQPVLKRAFFAVFVDLAVVVLAAYLAVGLKFDDWLLSESRARLVGMVGPLVPCVVMSFWMLELYKGAWRVAGIADFVRLCWAVVMAGGAGFVIARLVSTADGSVFVIYTLLHLVFAAGLRVSYLVLRQSMCRANSAGTPVLIYGAGLAGANVLRELISNRETALKPVGFIDDDPETHGTLIHRVPVLGSIDELEALVTGRGIGAVVVASKVIAPDKLDRAKSVCESLGVWLFRMTMTLDRMSTRGPVRRRGAFARPAVRTVPRGLARAPGWRS